MNTAAISLSLATGLLLMAGFPGAQASILIDDFNGEYQFVPTVDPESQVSEFAVPTALGGYRLLDQSGGDNYILVNSGVYPGMFVMNPKGNFGGLARAEWSGDGGLGGIDLTAGGDHFQFSGVLIATGIPGYELMNDFIVRVTDINGLESQLNLPWDEIRNQVLLSPPLLGFLIPFSSLNGEADLTLVDKIEIELVHTPLSLGGFAMDHFSVVSASSPGPTTYFDADVTDGIAPLTVQFANGSRDATSYSWDFGDGGTSTEENPSHTYADPGTYTVSLTVTGDAGSDSLTRTDYITVTGLRVPTADFVTDVTEGYAPLAVQFANNSSDATSYSWDFGDGGTSTEEFPSHTYVDPGTYTVSLTATGAGGSDTETKTDFIVVRKVYTVVLEGTSVVGIEDLPVADTTGEVTVYDVAFVEMSGSELYGDPPEFDFNSDENALLAMQAIFAVLNAEAPIPNGAGPSDSASFFIGGDQENDLIMALGGSYRDSQWDSCIGICVNGVSALLPGQTKTWADFTPAETAPRTVVTWKFQGNEYSGTGDDLSGEVTVTLDDEGTPGSVKITVDATALPDTATDSIKYIYFNTVFDSDSQGITVTVQNDAGGSYRGKADNEDGFSAGVTIPNLDDGPLFDFRLAFNSPDDVGAPYFDEGNDIFEATLTRDGLTVSDFFTPSAPNPIAAPLVHDILVGGSVAGQIEFSGTTDSVGSPSGFAEVVNLELSIADYTFDESHVLNEPGRRTRWDLTTGVLNDFRLRIANPEIGGGQINLLYLDPASDGFDSSNSSGIGDHTFAYAAYIAANLDCLGDEGTNADCSGVIPVPGSEPGPFEVALRAVQKEGVGAGGYFAGTIPSPTIEIERTGTDEITVSWTPETPGSLLQEALSLEPPNWVDSPSGPTNPVAVPIDGEAQFYRVHNPSRPAN